jgi:integrase
MGEGPWIPVNEIGTVTARRRPWNKGKLIGPKPPLQPKHVWAIRTRLQLAGRTRDLALFNPAIDRKVRGCDVVNLKVEDVAPHGHAVDRATVRQNKTGRPVRFEITEQTRQAIDDHLAVSWRRAGDFLFQVRRGKGRCLSTRQYARLLSEWIATIGLDPSLFGTHSLRRTMWRLNRRLKRGGASYRIKGCLWLGACDQGWAERDRLMRRGGGMNT